MKHIVNQVLNAALNQLQKELAVEIDINAQVERARDQQHGDFASNVALVLAKQLRMQPRQLAEKIIALIPVDETISKVEIAGPGFINFFLTDHAWQNVVSEILQAKQQYGRSDKGVGQKIHVEFVSSNPTGPLHVGHGRGAAYGSVVCDLLAAVGMDVHREYYVNDGGRQMDILATSVWLRYLQASGAEFAFPSNAYKGEYVCEIAATIRQQDGEKYMHSVAEIFADIPADEPQGGDKEIHIDALIARAKKLLGEKNYSHILDITLNSVLNDIRDDLAEFGVHFQEWFSERSLLTSGAVKQAFDTLEKNGHLYQQDGATWFRSTTFGDDKDRVVLRENGQPTYFGVDIAYRWNILQRGFPHLVNILGSDHHGYVPRVRAAIQAFGYSNDVLTTLIVQFAVLYRGSERAQMSTRSGEFVTLRELREEVTNDAARFFYVLRKCEQHMDFDLDLAKSQSNENPLYYIQYAHARICSVLRQLQEKNLSWDEQQGAAHLTQLSEPHERDLLVTLSRYPEIVETAAFNYEPHLVANYLRDLAHAFHTYYNAHQFIVDDSMLRNARLNLIAATKQVLANGLQLLGVQAPEVM